MVQTKINSEFPFIAVKNCLHEASTRQTGDTFQTLSGSGYQYIALCLTVCDQSAFDCNKNPLKFPRSVMWESHWQLQKTDSYLISFDRLHQAYYKNLAATLLDRLVNTESLKSRYFFAGKESAPQLVIIEYIEYATAIRRASAYFQYTRCETINYDLFFYWDTTKRGHFDAISITAPQNFWRSRDYRVSRKHQLACCFRSCGSTIGSGDNSAYPFCSPISGV